MNAALPYIAWLFLVVLAAVIWIPILRFLWGWRNAALFCLAAISLVAFLGLFVALVWRAAEWWLSVIPSWN